MRPHAVALRVASTKPIGKRSGDGWKFSIKVLTENG
jgi:hypothetical protein